MKIKQDRDKYNIGRNIRAFRLERGLTQEETAAKSQLMGLCMSRGSYSHIECGIGSIHVKVFLALAEILHMEIEDFFKGMQLR